MDAPLSLPHDRRGRTGRSGLRTDLRAWTQRRAVVQNLTKGRPRPAVPETAQ